MLVWRFPDKVIQEAEKTHVFSRSWPAWWLMPVIPALWEAEVDESIEVKSLRPAWSTWWNLISTKNTKISLALQLHTCNPSYSERLKQENHLNLGGGGCSELRSCHCTSAWETEPGCPSQIIIIITTKTSYHMENVHDVWTNTGWKNTQCVILANIFSLKHPNIFFKHCAVCQALC